jgi:hypothetical protein
MPIQAARNLYPGINAHLNSYLQNEPGAWRSYHSEHIVDIRRVLSEYLPPGYLALSEKGLQIAEIQVGSLTRSRLNIPDVTVYQSSGSTAQNPPSTLLATPPVETLPITTMIIDDDYLSGVVIYRASEGSLPGKPVTRLELLSPANKVGGSHHETYVLRRSETLQASLCLVEIDYLHQTPPITHALASYPAQEAGAYPYTVLVSDPRPTLEQGKTYVYGFGVDSPLPVVTVPLAGADNVLLDLGAAYNRTFESSPFFQMLADYELNPPQFERYTPADRERIEGLLSQWRTGQTGPS